MEAPARRAIAFVIYPGLTLLDLIGSLEVLSKNTVNKPCPVCDTAIMNEGYKGGSIYYCARCQVS